MAVFMRSAHQSMTSTSLRCVDPQPMSFGARLAKSYNTCSVARGAISDCRCWRHPIRRGCEVQRAAVRWTDLAA